MSSNYLSDDSKSGKTLMLFIDWVFRPIMFGIIVYLIGALIFYFISPMWFFSLPLWERGVAAIIIGLFLLFLQSEHNDNRNKNTF